MDDILEHLPVNQLNFQTLHGHYCFGDTAYACEGVLLAAGLGQKNLDLGFSP